MLIQGSAPISSFNNSAAVIAATGDVSGETDAEKKSRFMVVLTARSTIIPSSPSDPQPSFATSSVFSALSGSQPEIPRIVAFERLSTGECLLVWEGRSDRLFHIQYSDDLVTWQTDAVNLPVINGIGNWSIKTSQKRRFFRVFQDDDSETTPSSPDGGDGMTTFGGTIEFRYDGSIAEHAVVTANLPGGVDPVWVTFYLDGKRYGDGIGPHEDGSYVVKLPRETLEIGLRKLYAVIFTDSETTPSLEDSLQASAGILRTADYTFSSGNRSDMRQVGFRATEEEFSPDDPDLPTSTTFLANAPYAPYDGYWDIDIVHEGRLVRNWRGPINETGPFSASASWDGTDKNGNLMPAGIYYAKMSFGDGYQLDTVAVALQRREYKMLCLMEPSVTAPPNNAWIANYSPPWKGFITSSGNSNDANAAWGPWSKLKSLSNVVEELKKPLGSIHKSGKWRLHQWASGGPFNDAGAGNPAAVFETGGNPFNAYEMGLFLGHGVASSGGMYPGGTLPPQHYMPILKDKATGETVWVKSASHAKYGTAGSKLNWMFLMTCNSMRNQAPHAIYDAMITNGSFPFGSDLHVLCGYTTSIDIEAGMGKLMTDILIDAAKGSNTVVKAWENCWRFSSNSKTLNRTNGTIKQKRTARAVYWLECEDDSIYLGNSNAEKVTDPTGPYNLGRLEKKDFQ
jgi:hypothetical protein